jgi:hypothetical protein
MVFNITFNHNSVLLVEKTTDLSQITDKLYHIMYQMHPPQEGLELTTLVVIDTDCTSSDFFFLIIDKTGNSRSWFRNLIFENSGKMTNYAAFLPSLLSISTKS